MVKNKFLIKINRFLKSGTIQMLMKHLDDGTFKEFLEDWKWIFSYSRKYKWAIVIYTITGILGSTLGLGAGILTKYTIDIIANKKVSQAILLAFCMICSTVFSLLLASVVRWQAARISIMVNNDLRADIFRKVLDAQWMHLNRYSSGDLLQRISQDINSVAVNAVNWIPDLIIRMYTFVVTFAVICYYDVTMALIALLSTPFLIASSRIILRKMKESKKKVLEVNSSILGFQSEVFYNFDTIKSFGITDHYNKKLQDWQNRYEEVNLDCSLISIKANAWISGLGYAVTFLAFGYCLFRLWTGTITYGTMTFFLQQRNRLSSNMDSLAKKFPNMVSSAVAAHRVREIGELPGEKHSIQEKQELEQIRETGLEIHLHNICFSYEEGKSILNHVRFAARPGEMVGVVGESGSGKTTMFRMLIGLIYPENGKVILKVPGGEEISVNADVRSFFSYVPQGNTIFSGSIAENLRLVKEDATDTEIMDALKAACAWEFVKKMEGGIHAFIGEQGKGVSEGQAQRIAIARAVLRDAPILLLDEATSALDEETEKRVLENIRQKCPNKTCIISTHRTKTLSMCQRVYSITDRGIIERCL